MDTSKRFVEQAPAGYAANELDNALHVPYGIYDVRRNAGMLVVGTCTTSTRTLPEWNYTIKPYVQKQLRKM